MIKLREKVENLKLTVSVRRTLETMSTVRRISFSPWRIEFWMPGQISREKAGSSMPALESKKLRPSWVSSRPSLALFFTML